MTSWASGSAYEPYIGRWSRLAAERFLTWLAVPAGSSWLDVGCGTGALSAAILAESRASFVAALDLSYAYVAFARAQLSGARAAFIQGDAQALPVADDSVDATVSGLALNFLPQPEQGLAEMARATRQGGRVAVYLWDYAEGMRMIRLFWDAVIELDPDGADLDEARRFPICRPEALSRLFAGVGLYDIEVQAIDIPTTFRDFDDFWAPFLGGQGPAPSYLMSLSDARRLALRERLRERLPFASDGSISLTARAWAAAGRTSKRTRPRAGLHGQPA